MKKLMVIFIVLALPFVCVAGSIQDMHKTAIAGKNNNLPSWYSSVMFGWTGDMKEGTNYAFDTNGTPIKGTSNSLPVGTSYGEGAPDIGALLDTLNENITWSNSGDTYVNDSIGTLWMRVYISAAPTGTVSIFETNYDASDYIQINVTSTDTTVQGSYTATGNNDTAYGYGISYGGWIDIAYSWDQANGDHSCYDSGEWEEDLDELGHVLEADIANIVLGESIAGVAEMDGEKYVWVTQFAIVSGYETAKPW